MCVTVYVHVDEWEHMCMHVGVTVCPCACLYTHEHLDIYHDPLPFTQAGPIIALMGND